ncbi:SUMF1/EgtB/PvdO family nonheme iron enzyme [Baekduia sp.]|jgi:iron(II)-dependent oxidoreductase|uniref:SUMF1/EgtB/PvdO family nonheme iron enzyme n=1 Tax=Baekduia sp. TaxID=2600305 RepID=UPI002DFBCF50|nr:SUMF1/EgtB/PvdO family nonheme iron enzyme [Baekduia sp.]
MTDQAMTVTHTANVVEDLAAVRQRTLALVSHLATEDLERQIAPIMSPLVWDLGHIAAYEDLWLAHRHAGMELLRPDLAALYDAFETPRAVRGDLEILGYDDAVAYLDEVRARTLAALEITGPDPVLHEMVLQHELQHTETMRQAMAIAGLLAPGEPTLPPLTTPEGWLHVAAGTHALGASDAVFSYDNERPRHAVDVDAFAIALRPVTNATWLHFVEGGGYVRREWWSSEGWAWKEEYDITHHASVAAGDPDAPACHTSYFEAEALARWCGARLPTEAEWEKASARLDGVGHVWEWTASTFGGYPGFEAFPYREYSEVFFGDRYHVLRGGSWATHPRVATATFRNWDLPERRQIFAGVRLARDLGEPT